MSSVINRPAIPYNGPIIGGMHDGKRIEIMGTVPYGSDKFSVNLTTGLDTHSDVPFHMGVRFNGRVVVLNTQTRRSWGREERSGPFPFVQGGSFLMSILVNNLCYLVSVNGVHCWKYNHRLPIGRVSNLRIEGRIEVERIQCFDREQPIFVQPPTVVYPVSPTNSYNMQPSYVVLPNVPTAPTAYIHPAPPANPYSYPSGGLSLQPVYNPQVPFTYVIPGGLRPGLNIHISARPSSLFPHDWNINLQGPGSPQYSDICFHLGVRHHSRQVVRNTRLNGQWEWEESELGVRGFPFEAGRDFALMIRVEADRFMVALDNEHILEFRHRLHPLSKYETLFIERDVHLHSVSFS